MDETLVQAAQTLELGREEFSSGLCVQTVCRGFWLG